MSEPLKECPFCGSRDISFCDDWDEDGVSNMVIICNNCHVMTSPRERTCDDDGEIYEEGTDEYEDQKQELVEAWNHRSNSAYLGSDVISLGESIVDEISKTGNLKIPDAVIEKLGKLSDKLSTLKQQVRRESLNIDERGIIHEIHESSRLPLGEQVVAEMLNTSPQRSFSNTSSEITSLFSNSSNSPITVGLDPGRSDNNSSLYSAVPDPF